MINIIIKNKLYLVIFILFLLLSFSVNNTLYAKDKIKGKEKIKIVKNINNCGTYTVEGRYTIKKNPSGITQPVILLEKGSDSEITLYLDNPNITKVISDKYMDTNIKLKVKITTSCWFKCRATALHFIELIPLNRALKSIFSASGSRISNKIKCQSNSLE
ncbi:MAG: hypothetical protein HQK49_18110 [Oligoflexia bacterium]|nr:hypothetical protein [Oligoflexia bacterium]